MFIEFLFDPNQQLFYVSWVITVIFSITLHELAHGWMALRRGDRTPADLERMTINPLVHMGPFSLVALLVLGIAWGQMPIDPSRLRGRYGEAIVAAAGPATNLVLAILGLTALGLWIRLGAEPNTVFLENLRKFLWVFGAANFVLCLFNLLPLPPLDGSRILANFHRGYAMFISDPAHQGVLMFAFAMIFVFGSGIFTLAYRWADAYVRLIAVS
jgi:Zn-dependent protease